jgi:MFS family permease
VPRAATLLGISVLWIPLAFAFDGATLLVLPVLLDRVVPPDRLATALGLLTATALLAAVVVQPIAGTLSDRLRPGFGRRGFIRAASVGVLLGLALLGAGSGFVAIVAGYIVLQVTAAAVQAAQQGFIPDLIPAPWRGRAAGLKGLFDVGGGFLAFAVLGALIAAAGTGVAIIAIAALFVLALGATAVLVDERHPATPIDVRDARSLNGTFVRLVASRFAFLFGIYAVGRFFVLLMASRLGLDTEQAAATAGAVLAALTLLTAASALPAGWIADRGGRLPVMVCGSVFATIGIVLLVGANSEESVLLSGAVIGIGSGAFAAANWAMTADVIPQSNAARFMGLANIGTGGAAAAAGLMGPILDVAGRGTGFTLLLAIAAIATAASLLPLHGLADGRGLRLSSARA